MTYLEQLESDILTKIYSLQDQKLKCQCVNEHDFNRLGEVIERLYEDLDSIRERM